MPLPTQLDDYDRYVKEVCRIGQRADCCRYLTCGATGWDCAKHGEHRAHLDMRVATQTINARGDNCEGYKR